MALVTTRTGRLSVVACVLVGAGFATSALATPVLRSADVRITMTSPTSCDVTMDLTVAGASDVDHRIESFEGSRVELIDVHGARQTGGVRAIGRTESLVLSPARCAVRIQLPGGAVREPRESVPDLAAGGADRRPAWCGASDDRHPADDVGWEFDARLRVDPYARVDNARASSVTRDCAVRARRRRARLGRRTNHGRDRGDGLCGRQRHLGVAGETVTMGFGASFYGFFVAAVIWLVVYFLWAFAAVQTGCSVWWVE